ncbi:helix-turn-helix transcriptional regulator [Bifidobacterium aquikefiri]|uniref:helix-turn-helix transcriptional regulator n=1 Tax=Bifidobacterium aquikefiri TaxID=1653207 RepID=UPI0023F4AE85|nr:hypothetical protein [Bifidobacterium aquikefiri]
MKAVSTFLTAEDIGLRYGKAKTSIYRIHCYNPEQLPPAIKIGSSLRWRLEDVEAWEQAKVGQK